MAFPGFARRNGEHHERDPAPAEPEHRVQQAACQVHVHCRTAVRRTGRNLDQADSFKQTKDEDQSIGRE